MQQTSRSQAGNRWCVRAAASNCYLLLDKCTTGGTTRFHVLSPFSPSSTDAYRDKRALSELFSHVALARYNKHASQPASEARPGWRALLPSIPSQACFAWDGRGGRRGRREDIMPDRAFETHLGGALQMMTHAMLSKSPRPRSSGLMSIPSLLIGSVATPLHRLSLCLPNTFALRLRSLGQRCDVPEPKRRIDETNTGVESSIDPDQ
ncbi:hypothetical protein QBC34DRAFT_172436 [Podospora aff. communis PSN243]|uniref:Uncharacterized protein n=1 Tax=Podospora aff. communis PSN243 TaxID=3040156 RepID=A0AAV9H2P8_9PEZI|nr:hypothetical protein QBC34DRAFT_172436 [Podospora aff. communis PSN243]